MKFKKEHLMRFLTLLFSLTLIFPSQVYAERLPQINRLDRTVTLQEEDGSPIMYDPFRLKFQNTSFTDNADGTGTLSYSGTTSGASGAGLVGIVTGTGSPTVDQMQEYLNNTGSSGYFTGGIITDAGFGTVNITAGEGFIRTASDDNAELVSFKWDAIIELAIPIDTTRYIFVDDAGNVTLNASEFTEAVDNIMVGVATNEDDTVIHAFNLGVRLEESIGQMGRYIRRVDDIQRDRRKGGLIFGQSGDANRDVTMSAGSLWWGRTEYLISEFDTTGVGDTFETYSSAGQVATDVDQWPNAQYDDSVGGLTNMGNNKWAVLWWYIEPDDHIVMIYGRDQYSTEGRAEEELPPSSNIPNRISAASTIAAKFIFQKSDDVASKIESAFGVPFTSSGVTDHKNLASLAWSVAGHDPLDSALTTSNGSILANATASGILTLGGIGGSNNENLTFDFESSANNVILGTTTGADDLVIPDLFGLRFGTGQDTRIIFQTQGNDSWQFGTRVASADGSGYISFMNKDHIANPNRSPLATSLNSVLRIYSSDATVATDYIESGHNQADGFITVGAGSLLLSSQFGSTIFKDSGTSGFLIRADADAFDEVLFTTYDATGNQIVITNNANVSLDHDHPFTDNPTIFIHSDLSPNTNNTRWGSLAHTGTAGDAGTFLIDSGSGGITLNDDTTISGTLDVGGDLSVSGNLVVDGNTGMGDAPTPNVLNVLRDFAGDGSTLRNVMQITRTHSNGAGDDGIGATLLFRVESKTEGVTANVASIGGFAVDATEGNIDGAFVFRTVFNSGGLTTRMTILPEGNVGIGTDSPVVRLHIKDTNPLMQMTSDTTGNTSGDGFQIGLSGLNAFIIQKENADLKIRTNNIDRMTIEGGGNVIISNDLTVNGDLAVGSSGIFTAPNDLDNNRIGRLIIGKLPGIGAAVQGFKYAGLPDLDYAFTQSNTGATVFNTQAGQTLSLRQTNLERAKITTGGDFHVVNNLGIGTATPATSAKLDITSTTGALLISRMTTGQRDSLTAVNGMIIYNSTTNAFNFYENGSWVTGSGLT